MVQTFFRQLWHIPIPKSKEYKTKDLQYDILLQSGPLTPLTLNLFISLSVVLKTGGNRDWLTTAACWHTRHLLRGASELCANVFALSSRTVSGCGGTRSIVHCLVPPALT